MQALPWLQSSQIIGSSNNNKHKAALPPTRRKALGARGLQWLAACSMAMPVIVFPTR
jgi:hypothetical protein